MPHTDSLFCLDVSLPPNQSMSSTNMMGGAVLSKIIRFGNRPTFAIYPPLNFDSSSNYSEKTSPTILSRIPTPLPKLSCYLFPYQDVELFASMFLGMLPKTTVASEVVFAIQSFSFMKGCFSQLEANRHLFSFKSFFYLLSHLQ